MRFVYYMLALVALTAVYCVAARLGMFYNHGYGLMAPLWLPSGIGVALIWLYGRRYAPVIPLGCLAIALWLGRGAEFGLIGGVIALGEAVIAAWLLNRARVSPVFRHARDIWLFILLGALIPSLLFNLVGSALIAAGEVVQPNPYWSGAFTWSLGDMMGILLATPLITHWRHWPFARLRNGMAWSAVMLATLALGLVIMLYVGRPLGLSFLLLPLAVLAAVTSGMAGATSVVMLLALCVLGLDVSQASTSMPVFVRMLFVGTAAITSYLLAVELAGRSRVENRLRHQTTHDRLTGLPNRTGFNQKLEQLVKAPGVHALLYLDLDQFKLLNDSRGHELGDRFLAALARQLMAAIPDGAVLARMGGDEFSVLAANTDGTGAHKLAESLSRSIQDFRYVEEGLEYRVDASVGITTFAKGERSSAVLSRADIACNTAKQKGHNHIQNYRRNDASMRADHQEIRRISQLDTALRDGGFALVRQRIQPLNEDNEPPVYEMLLRLRDGGGRLLGPGAFLTAAMRYGLMPKIDRWVIERSFRYRASKSSPLTLNVNMDGLTLSDPAIFDDVMAFKSRYGVNANEICFEITETVAIRHLARAAETMQRFVDAGFRFALDDFGKGVANFGYLQELPLDMIKIDGRFIRDIDRDPANPIIVETLVKLAALKGIGCIGEWIESDDILTTIRTLGVGYGQGFHLHEPELINLPA